MLVNFLPYCPESVLFVKEDGFPILFIDFKGDFSFQGFRMLE
jgi:hypothetical protein